MLRRLDEAIRQKTALERRKRDAAQESRILAARARGMQWSQIAASFRISEGQARWVLQRKMTPQAVARLEGQEPRTGLRPGQGPGVGVSEAARLLRVSRRTVYAWARAGKLRVTNNELGQTRILLERSAITVTGVELIPLAHPDVEPAA